MIHTPIQYIKGVGPYLATLLAKRGIETVRDLFYHVPTRYIDRREIASISKLTAGHDRTVIGEVVTSGVAYLGRKRKKIFEVILKDDSGALSAKWFHFHKSFTEGLFKSKTKILLSGEATEYNGVVGFVHPEVEILSDEEDEDFEVGGKILPIYASTEGLSQRQIRKIVRSAWDKYNENIKCVLTEEILKAHGLVETKEAFSTLHFPDKDLDLEMLNGRRSAAHRTLIFEEFFLFELALMLKKNIHDLHKGIKYKWSDQLMKKLHGVLGFDLTASQSRVIEDIRRDMERETPMNRLLQGDVGSGKTVVAVAGALQAISNGYQAAIMAPTEILAEQHFKNISRYMEALEIPMALITSSYKGSHRDKIYAGTSTGAIKLLVGTHSLIQEDLLFAKLGFVVIDEQHRFGVLQRQALHKKGVEPDVLVMTATPIPRTLAMTLYGDLDISVINEMPIGRKPIITKLYREKDRQRLYTGMQKELGRRHQIYVVYPLIEESEKIDLKNATEMCKVLKSIFEPTYKVELLHGRMKADEKDSIMSRFKSGEISILAATSVVEVGVDVANATVMVIEHSERFGLSQLHQLRGRVGRSDLQSYCILMADWRTSEDAKRRLDIMQETTDGFRISEEDLDIRGPGEFMGTRQSGLPEFGVANLALDVDILGPAREAAFKIDLNKYTELKNEVVSRWGQKLELTKV